MTATIHRLHNSTPVASYLRVGHRDHKWLVDSGNRTRSEAPLFRGNTNSLVILGRGA
jgi:hypothetical protein